MSIYRQLKAPKMSPKQKDAPRRAAQVKWQRFSHISKIQVQGDTAINTHMLSNLLCTTCGSLCRFLLYKWSWTLAYHREQRPLFLVLFDSMSFTYAIARLRVKIERETHACESRCACGLDLIVLDKIFNEGKCFKSTSRSAA